MILNGDCIIELKKLADNSVDSLITDPPAGISFMGKEWDSDKGGRDGWINWMTEVMQECLRVLKPGAHGLVWAIPRTSHWTATALENAGFEVRDVVTHLFGSGFPKSLDISKAIDKAAGASREVIGSKGYSAPNIKGNKYNDAEGEREACNITAPSTNEAKQWQGWGTALKPASEHWILVRKPLEEKTVAKNVLKHGCGGINIDASRVETGDNLNGGRYSDNKIGEDKSAYGKGINARSKLDYTQPQGRFPANLVLSHSEHCEDGQCDIECAIKAMDEQSGISKPTKERTGIAGGNKGETKWSGLKTDQHIGQWYGNDGSTGASRFFYCAKISTSERNAGLEGMPDVIAGIGDDRPSGQSMSRLDGRPPRVTKNSHPTVKPKKLMSYFIKMITPPKGIVLDPFMGSGSTGIAAKECGFNFIGIEKEAEYFEIAVKRIEHTSIGVS